MRGGRGKRARVSKVLQVDPVAASDMQFGSGSQCVEIAASSTGGDAYKQSSSGPQSVETAAPLSDQVSESDTQSTSGEQCYSSSKVNKSRLMMRSDLTAEDEESMVEWLRENPQIYNKKLSTYKDKCKKDALWAEQAQVLGKDVSMLIVWYRSIRTRFGKLTKPKSGAGTGDRTDRDQWILTKFEFLKPHIHEVQSSQVHSQRRQRFPSNFL
ncbi:uncharacterized protein LOC132730586 [Ruditapes philippinarum]|uniref:uncharacterized protein LOC132730586 n=1 Tax=Ruditapes philippinarum TaxID=129788 RepID=UPI00295A7B1C|nr:uncharacterized protein LOC132730586 [Ruditapes philippinarum]